MAADRSPCRGCDLEKEDKNNRVCMMCVDRIEYIKAIGGMTYSVPESAEKLARVPVGRCAGENDREEKTMTENQENYQVTKKITKICADPDCKDKGLPLPIGGFKNSARSKDGKMHICAKCQARKIRDGFAKRKALRGVKAEVIKKEKKPSANTSEIIIPKDDEYVLTLDFSGFTEVLEKIQKIAKEQLRTPENQAIYWLKISAA